MTFQKEDQQSVPEVIDFIQDHYHEGLRQLVPEMLVLADRVERVHQKHPSCPKGLASFLSKMWEALNFHMEREEKILFDLIKRGSYKEALLPIHVMREEHDEHVEALEMLRTFKVKYPLPVDACRTWQALFKTLDIFERDLLEHIHFENDILFPRVLSMG